ncbi:ABC transporter ATP-binding protein [Jiella sonneratiae]|uniref:ABC transporter ATP-binding protein n=1 Tax=Jiella sonneratiae TaxID=2816856 RepID=A0ABS3IZI0_9HYPH|nr:ABC transporter ATP-binding protein [Jiella sonneratiae]MBO0902833.1 ABC transporter ATP-binding protein [Jiella sonneratiae]
MHDLELINVGKVYDDGTVAVAGFDLAVEKGEFVAFLGPSGCGKTTTLRMIAGFETITSGDVVIKGRNVSDLPPERRPTSMIFQNYALFPHMNVFENVEYGLKVRGLAKAERQERVGRILDKFGLSAIAQERADNLSGGQRQRIALARGLVVEPDILLLDEPLGALDANLRRVIQDELKILQRELGITFVFVTHAQSEALGLSDRVVVMSNGKVEQISTPRELYTRPATPFVAGFIGANTIFRGEASQGGAPGRCRIDTRFGPMEGVGDAGALAGRSAIIAIPSDAIAVHPAGWSGSGINTVTSTVLSRDVVGHIGHLSLALDGAEPILVESHVDRFAGLQAGPGDTVTITWEPERSSVLAA